MARRALDYLVGFTLSPVLWRKLPGSRSAGRVQSVALRLICDREAEIEVFRAREYWTIEALFLTPGGAPFTARLTHLNGKRLDQFDLNNETLALAAKAAVEAGDFHRRFGRAQAGQAQPAAAVHHLHPAAGGIPQAWLRRAADHAAGARPVRRRRDRRRDHRPDHLYADRWRADGAARPSPASATTCKDSFGPNYLPAAPREYTSKAKNAQEAHEAIRPTDVSRTPDQHRSRPEPRPAPAV